MRKFSDEEAREYMNKFLKGEMAQSPEFSSYMHKLISVEYVRTAYGQNETCGGCTLGDGQDCVPPSHYVDIFKAAYGIKDHEARCYLFMGWSSGGCSNSYGDYSDIYHYEFFKGNVIYKSVYEYYIERNLIN